MPRLAVNRSRAFTVLLVAALTSSAGCGLLQKAAMGSLMEDMAIAANKQEDAELVAQAMPTFLLIVDGLIEGNPNDTDRLIDASKAYLSYGALIELSAPDRARLMYRRGKDYGLRALSQKRRAVRPLLAAPFSQFTEITAVLRPEDIDLVFWAASGWGAWISLSTDSMAALADLPRVILLMEWVIERDETILFGSPHLFLGMYYAALPPILGGKPERSREHFERAIELSDGKSSMVYVQMARYYAKQIYDRELYISLLRRALDVPVDAVAELTLQNAAARELAHTLLDDTDAFF
jgi:hypothetical protein